MAEGEEGAGDAIGCVANESVFDGEVACDAADAEFLYAFDVGEDG